MEGMKFSQSFTSRVELFSDISAKDYMKTIGIQREIEIIPL